MRRFRQIAQGEHLLSIFMVVALGCASRETTSTFKRTYPSGQLLVEMEMKNGRPEGGATTYHKNGTVDSQGTYRQGRRHGLFHFWDDEGNWLRQALYAGAKMLWTSDLRSAYPPEDLSVDESLAASGDILTGEPTVSQEAIARAAPKTRFLNGLPGHGSFLQLSIGSGSGVSNSSARRIGVRGSYADGRLGGSVAITIARFEDDFVSAWGKPVADIQTSYLLPYSGSGVFVARAGVVLPLGNDNNRSALAGAAGVVQAPNEAIYVLPSTLGTRGSLSWFSASKYVISQLDFGLDVGLFGYPHGVHPIIHANGALGLGLKGFFVGPEGSTAISWAGELSDMLLFGGALYGSVSDTSVGLFIGKQDGTPVFRGRMSYEF